MSDINLGHVRVVSNPSNEPGANIGHPAPNSHQIEARVVSLEEAQRSTQFKILQPQWLPSPELELASVFQLVSPFSDRTLNTVLKYRASPTHWITIRQSFVPKKIQIPFTAWEGRIGGRPAAFFIHDVPIQNHPGHISLLKCLWEYEPFLIEIQGPGISSEEIGRIAESLA